MIRADELVKRYQGHVVVDHLSFEVQAGETLCLIGPSGCGKSTTLKMINRLIDPDEGIIRVKDMNILQQDPVALRRTMGYVSQQGSLFPHWTVKQNIGLVPGLEGWTKVKILERTRDLLDLIKLEPEQYLGKYPLELSGGEQQRVSIARALAVDPPILLMDEPFSALDPLTRFELRREFREIKKKLNKTTVFVTHDLQEAFLLADHILLMDSGAIMQYGTRKELQEHPANEFVRSFINAQVNEN
ncbi:MAG: ABC transporter ATP-binding protein [Cyclobacteriaceae bacterium]|nr:ABC transporter ATP-binding protein [Cyclobacteriaceae bacterium]